MSWSGACVGVRFLNILDTRSSSVDQWLVSRSRTSAYVKVRSQAEGGSRGKDARSAGKDRRGGFMGISSGSTWIGRSRAGRHLVRCVELLTLLKDGSKLVLGAFWNSKARLGRKVPRISS